jgi:alpha-tubulin suppressor-like RCC1 family protein
MEMRRQAAWIGAASVIAATLGLGCWAGRSALEDVEPERAPSSGGAGGAGGGSSAGGAGGDGCSSTCPVELPTRMVKLTAGDDHSCARSSDGSIQCWGSNFAGELGLGDSQDRGDAPGEMGDALPAIDLGKGKKTVAITAGYLESCALIDDGSVKCWGSNQGGALGLGDTQDRGDKPDQMSDNLPTVDLGEGMRAVDIDSGNGQTCALLALGRVKCWGKCVLSPLGLGDVLDHGDAPNEMGDNLPFIDLGKDKTAVGIATGDYHICALLQGGAVKCWGNGGELGLGDDRLRGIKSDEMGDNLPAVDLGKDMKAAAITAGSSHTCALLDDGRVKCWGFNLFGQLGLGDTLYRGGEPNQMGDNLPAVDLGKGMKAAAITAGSYHTCALLQGGSVKCWGINNFGQLGRGDTLDRGVSPNQMGDDLPAIDLGKGKKAVEIAAGASHTCALLDDDSIKCWGRNFRGVLGLGDKFDRGDEPNEMGDDLPAVEL